MESLFFGDYLIKNGVISQTQLQNAVDLQKDNNMLIGELAVHRGYISVEQLGTLLHDPDMLHLRLGECMVEKGLITDRQLSELLTTQAQNHIFLGAALIKLGYMEAEDLECFLEKFRVEENSLEESIKKSISEAHGGPVFAQTIDFTRFFLYRIGFLSKINRITSELPQKESSNCFAAEQRHKKNGSHYACFFIPDELLVQIASNQISEKNNSYDELMEDVAQSLFNLNYAICAKLRKQGHTVQHEAIMQTIPDFTRCSTAHMTTILGDFQISYIS